MTGYICSCTERLHNAWWTPGRVPGVQLLFKYACWKEEYRLCFGVNGKDGGRECIIVKITINQVADMIYLETNREKVNVFPWYFSIANHNMLFCHQFAWRTCWKHEQLCKSVKLSPKCIIRLNLQLLMGACMCRLLGWFTQTSNAALSELRQWPMTTL